MNAIQDTLFWRAARGETTERPPVWLMRQAGRSDPAYRALRTGSSLELEELFRTPDIAARISLLPHRWGVDALIFFQDILSPLAGMGAPFVFRPGPKPEVPFNDVQEFASLHDFDMGEEMPFIAEIFRLIRDAVGPTVPLLGFAGAPLTLLAFLAEGGSPAPELPRTRQLLQEQPVAAHRLLDLLAEVTASYLKYQIASGAHAVQLFESVAQYFTRAEYLEFALPRQQQIFTALEGLAPTICFARLLDDHIPVGDLVAAGADILSLSEHHSIKGVREAFGASLLVQGNLDNRLLAQGPMEAIEQAALACIEDGACRGHIFNLSHGLLAETPHEHVTALVNFVRQYQR